MPLPLVPGGLGAHTRRAASARAPRAAAALRPRPLAADGSRWQHARVATWPGAGERVRRGRKLPGAREPRPHHRGAAPRPPRRPAPAQPRPPRPPLPTSAVCQLTERGIGALRVPARRRRGLQSWKGSSSSTSAASRLLNAVGSIFMPCSSSAPAASRRGAGWAVGRGHRSAWRVLSSRSGRAPE